MSTVSERVAAGMAFLDLREPGAAGKIDVFRLDTSDCFDCILGQVWGGYGRACARFGLSDEMAVELGFTCEARYDEDDEVADAQFAELTAEWRRVITERRAAA